MTIQGIDISSVQGIITPEQWAALVARGLRFAVAKCGNGNDQPDPDFERDVTNARAAGLVVGAYNFVFPLPDVIGHVRRDPLEQAQDHFQQCGGLGRDAGTIPPCVDIEWPAPSLWWKWDVDAAFIQQWCLAYLAKTEALFGVAPLVYTYPDFAKHVGFGPDFAKYRLWAAEYDVLQDIAPWHGYSILQTAGGQSSVLSRRFMQTNVLPGGLPVDTDIMDSEEVLKGLTSR